MMKSDLIRMITHLFVETVKGVAEDQNLSYAGALEVIQQNTESRDDNVIDEMIAGRFGVAYLRGRISVNDRVSAIDDLFCSLISFFDSHPEIDPGDFFFDRFSQKTNDLLKRVINSPKYSNDDQTKNKSLEEKIGVILDAMRRIDGL